MERLFDKEERYILKNLMEYPEEFKDKCLSVYEDDEEMKELLEEGSVLVLRKIRMEIEKGITSSDIVEAYETDKMDEIVQRAYMIEKNKELKEDIMKLYNEQYISKGKYIRNGQVFINPCMYRPPVSAEIIPDEKMAPLEKAIQEHITCLENRRAAGRIAAEKHIAGGGMPLSLTKDDE